jgi:uncharacterized protein (DUF2164 family)
MTRTEMKLKAQEMLLDGISTKLGYWYESQGYEIPDESRDEFQAIMQREADRVAKMFGYERAWVS